MPQQDETSPDAFRYRKGWSTTARRNAVDRVRVALTKGTDLRTVSESVAETIGDLFTAKACTISLLDARGYRDVVNIGALAPNDKRFPDPDYYYDVERFPLSTQLLMDGSGYLSTTTTSPIYKEYQGMWPQMPAGSFLGVPIIAAGEVRGELYLARGEEAPLFMNDDLEMARDLATQYGSVLPSLLSSESQKDS
ncbi:MAG TPA: GAF domain-containing protein [Actinomycetes bacterium]|nr:GAF domain-containing protein [Actinomycetes bacterium]